MKTSAQARTSLKRAEDTVDQEHDVSANKATGAQSIRRALRVLRILAVGQEHGVRLTDIVEESGLTRPTVHRILSVLIEESAVEQDPATRRYMIGQEMSLLGLARPARFPIRAVADPYLRHISEQVGDTVYLTIRSGFDSICVDRKLGTYPVKVMSIEVGVRRPLGVGVAGLALLAQLGESESATIIKANQQRLENHQMTVTKLNERARAARERICIRAGGHHARHKRACNPDCQQVGRGDRCHQHCGDRQSDAGAPSHGTGQPVAGASPFNFKTSGRNRESPTLKPTTCMCRSRVFFVNRTYGFHANFTGRHVKKPRQNRGFVFTQR
jgi:DNA-binding IclR family transcriptional regulator